MKQVSNRELMEKIDQGIRAGVKKALEDHKKAGIEIAVWRNGKVEKIPAKKIKI